MTAWGTLMRIGFWVFTGDMEIRRELEKTGTARGRFRSWIPSRGAGGDVGFDWWRGGKGEDPEAANRRDNEANMWAWWAFGNPKKTGGDSRVPVLGMRRIRTTTGAKRR